MNPMIVFVMVAQTVIFLGWAFIAFRTLIRLNRVAVERRTDSGHGAVGFSQTIATFGDFARGRILAHDRNLLILLTLALMASIYIRSTMA